MMMVLAGGAPALAQAWRLGLLSDTQWVGKDDGRNPNSVAVSIVEQINREFVRSGVKGLASHILTLWGMARGLGTAETDVYALCLTYVPAKAPAAELQRGTIGLATRRPNGAWVNAVEANAGGTKNFVAGPWDAAYCLGMYSVDPATHTAWAVINYNAEFAVVGGLKRELIGPGALSAELAGVGRL